MIEVMSPRSESWNGESSASSSNVAFSQQTRSQQISSSSLNAATHPQRAKHSENPYQDLLSLASAELESMRKPSSSATQSNERSFPPACLRLLYSSSQQNHLCIDCGSSADVTWASVSYGVTLCLRCSGRHRGLGVRCSYVKSLTLDSWNHGQGNSAKTTTKSQFRLFPFTPQVLAMLEGGNAQLSQFFSRHKMSNSDYSNRTTPLIDRYKTKAASFYKLHLAKHANEVVENGVYMGREASREASKSRSRKGRKKSHHSHSQRTLPTVEEAKETQLSDP
eukprot:CCRYP_000338-RE/>CCRYP_000338-RE protein AED:0.36 eAED:0.37 QI:2710/0.5/0.66/1/0/0/3/0/278